VKILKARLKAELQTEPYEMISGRMNAEPFLRKTTFAILFLFTITCALVLAQSLNAAVTNTRSAATLYSRNCASCHGRDGRAKTVKAKKNHARDLADSEWQNRVSDERIFNSIMNGKGKMPGYAKKLSESETDSLVNYVRSLKK
jgi:mono/diheme cytochrome c family protein